MHAIVAWIEANPSTATLLGVVLGAFLGSFFPALFKAIGRIISRYRPALQVRHQSHFSWFAFFKNGSRTHLVILHSPELVNTGDRLVTVKDIRIRYMLKNGTFSPEIRPVTLPRPPSLDVGNDHTKVYPVFFTQFPTIEAYGANITQSGDIAPAETQSGFLLYIEDVVDIGTPKVLDGTLQIETRAYPESMVRVSCRGKCVRLAHEAFEEVIPGITEYQARRRNLGAVSRFPAS